MNLYGFVYNSAVNRWDILGNAPGDEWDTLDEAVASATEHISFWTKLSRITGNIELSSWLLSETPEKLIGKSNFGLNHSVYPDSNGANISNAIVGKEHGIRIFCDFENGTFIEGAMAVGTLPSAMEYKSGFRGMIDMGLSTPPELSLIHI